MKIEEIEAEAKQTVLVRASEVLEYQIGLTEWTLTRPPGELNLMYDISCRNDALLVLLEVIEEAWASRLTELEGQTEFRGNAERFKQLCRQLGDRCESLTN